MANRLESSIVINQPAEDIFTFISDPDNHPRFVPGMLEFKKTSPGPFEQVGTSIQGVRRFLGQRLELPYEITEYQAGSRLGMKGAMGPITFMDGYVLEPMGSSTRVKFWLEFMLTGVMKITRPFFAIVGKAHANETLANLANALERSK
ncbi:MAG TPA: SRPBCC family protein [Anaerolineales bacterium]|nr:SRPBCC family protein [Anaerolineales bacterium]HLO32971.1 SRPBCC family protein [Anaerolineales bacterium]